MSEELNPKRYDFTSPTWCGGSLSADREEREDGEYVLLEDVQEAIDFWNRRAPAEPMPSTVAATTAKNAVVRFDVQRMAAALNSESVLLPNGATTEQMRDLILSHIPAQTGINSGGHLSEAKTAETRMDTGLEGGLLIVTSALNQLLDAGGADENHPLAGLVYAVGEVISKYEGNKEYAKTAYCIEAPSTASEVELLALFDAYGNALYYRRENDFREQFIDALAALAKPSTIASAENSQSQQECIPPSRAEPAELDFLEEWLRFAEEPVGMVCCGMPTTGAQYMGQTEMVCCGNGEPAERDAVEVIAAMQARHKVLTAEVLASRTTEEFQ